MFKSFEMKKKLYKCSICGEKTPYVTALGRIKRPYAWANHRGWICGKCNNEGIES